MRPLLRRIGIDANPLLEPNLTGVPLYVDSLVRELRTLHADDEQLVLVAWKPVEALRMALDRHGFDWRDDPSLTFVSDAFDARISARFPAIARTPASWLTRKVDGRVLGPLNVAMARRSIGPLDLLHHTDGARPTRTAKRHVMTVHDLATRLFPETHRPEVIASYEFSFAFARDRADHIIADSESTRQGVIENLGIAPDRVTTVPLAARVTLPKSVSPEAVDAVRQRFGLPGDTRYVLAGGSLEPRKNLPRLIEAFGRLIQQEPGLGDLRLALAGARWHGASAVEEAIARLGLRERVVTLGYVSDLDLAALMSGCACFAYVSLYEGFGLPVLEAMTLGAPVVTSNSSSLPEVAGDAALQVDPTDIDAIAGAIRRVLVDSELATSLRAKGRVQAAKFSWRRTAEEHLRIYREASAA